MVFLSNVTLTGSVCGRGLVFLQLWLSKACRLAESSISISGDAEFQAKMLGCVL